jgi:glucosamine--fructose-6-phosphate aminotransferase (isomerizing)
MCGIVGINSREAVSGRIVEGLRRLEYRGYDSAGVATIDEGAIGRRRSVGKLFALEQLLSENPLPGAIGIGHTRWATHGRPTEENAHPHGAEAVSVVHNGIIENFAELKAELSDKGFDFESQTDTEVVTRLIEDRLATGLSPKEAFRETLTRLEGAFALCVLFAKDADHIYCARRGSPLALGVGDGEMFLGSDALALAPFTRKVVYLEDGDWGIVGRESFDLYTEDNETVEREVNLSDASAALIGKGRHRHFMAKEIAEQPDVLGHALSTYLRPNRGAVALPDTALDFSKAERLTISGCGTAYLAGLIAKYWFEGLARLPVEIDIASELRYRDVPYRKGDAALFVSQSGETADTLAAMRDAKEAGVLTGAVVNVPESTMAREAEAVFPIKAGPEIGVASTKAFTCQLATLACLAVAAGRARGHVSEEEEGRLVGSLMTIPRLMAEVLSGEEAIEELSHLLVPARDVLYLGRGVSFPLALEGALKLKEISYIHAEGYAAGELKHGPIALVDEHVPVIVLAPDDRHFDKTISNMHEVMARGGQCILISTASGIERAKGEQPLTGSFVMPEAHSLFAPLLYAVPIQLIAYHTAVLKGTDVDQPRNLAKSVTVE